MSWWLLVLTALTAVLQAAAAVAALRLGRWTRHYQGWWMLGLAFALLAVRRAFVAYQAFALGHPPAEGEAYTLLVAAFSLLAVMALSAPLRQGFHDKQQLALEAERERLQTILDRQQEVQEAILRCGVFGAALVENGSLAWVSEGLSALLGGASLNHGPFRALFYTPEEGDALLEKALASSPEAFPVRTEAMLLKLDGGTPLFRLSLCAVDPGHPEKGLALIVEDHSDLRAALSREADVSRFLQTVVDTADIWINTLDNEARVVLWNRAAEQISGYTRGEVAGRSEIWRCLYPDPDYLAAVAAKAGSILHEDDVARDFQTTIRTKRGEERILTWDSRALRDEQGRVTGSLALGRDITDRKRTEEELERVHFIQDLILRHTALGLAMIRHRQFDWVNPRLAEILGTTPDQLVGRSTRLIHVDETGLETMEREAESQLRKGRIADFRQPIRCWGGSKRWCRLMGRALNPQHPEEGSIWVMEDIQERVAAEEALMESEARFRAIFEGTQDALLLLTRTAIFDCNARSLEVFGFDQKPEFLSRHPVELSSTQQAGGEAAQTLWERYLQIALLEGSVIFPWEFRSPRREAFQAQVMISSFSMGSRKVFQASVRPQGRP